MNKILILFFTTILIFSCGKVNKSDAYGNFTANEIIISSENNGKIILINFDEGSSIKVGDTLAIIDTQILFLQKQQLIAQKNAISNKFKNIIAEVNVMNEQKNVLENDRKRFENLLKDSAISKQQYENVAGQINVIDQKINAAKTNNTSVFGEIETIEASINLIEKQISNCYIKSPIGGIVLEKYVNNFELATIGKPIFKIADLQNMELTVYISENQLSLVKLEQQITVQIDSIQNTKKISGKITWISSSAEFTPKIIQTKNERVNLVYAVKIDVKNDGSIKIGMPADVIF